MYTKTIYSGAQCTPHCQGIAIDSERRYMYFSFTTALIKTDMNGHFIGSVTGLGGHLGCIAFHDGKVYGSLEYKHDIIGLGVEKASKIGNLPTNDAFYVAIFDVEKINSANIPADSAIMTTVYLKEVYDDYMAPNHKHGCSGIDGITFAPEPGSEAPYKYLYVAYGVYEDRDRMDNDYQVILRYDIKDWDKYKRPLSQTEHHCSGPEKPDDKYFIYTGNTNFGVQNLEYDPHTNSLLMAVYVGYKDAFPNFPMFMADMSQKPQTKKLMGYDGAEGKCIPLKKSGIFDEKSGIYGWNFEYGSTGMISLGDGYYYFSHEIEAPTYSDTTVYLYKWDGTNPFTKA